MRQKKCSKPPSGQTKSIGHGSGTVVVISRYTLFFLRCLTSVVPYRWGAKHHVDISDRYSDIIGDIFICFRCRRELELDLSSYTLDTIQSRGEFLLCRGYQRMRTSSHPFLVLILMPRSESLRPENLQLLEREHSLKAQLDPARAVRPIKLANDGRRRAVLVREDLERRVTTWAITAFISFQKPHFRQLYTEIRLSKDCFHIRTIRLKPRSALGIGQTPDAINNQKAISNFIGSTSIQTCLSSGQN